MKTGAEMEVMQPQAEIAGSHQELGKGKEDLPQSLQGNCSPDNTLISDFWVPEL